MIILRVRCFLLLFLLIVKCKKNLTMNRFLESLLKGEIYKNKTRLNMKIIATLKLNRQ